MIPWISGMKGAAAVQQRSTTPLVSIAGGLLLLLGFGFAFLLDRAYAAQADPKKTGEEPNTVVLIVVDQQVPPKSNILVPIEKAGDAPPKPQSGAAGNLDNTIEMLIRYNPPDKPGVPAPKTVQVTLSVTRTPKAALQAPTSENPKNDPHPATPDPKGELKILSADGKKTLIADLQNPGVVNVTPGVGNETKVLLNGKIASSALNDITIKASLKNDNTVQDECRATVLDAAWTIKVVGDKLDTTRIHPPATFIQLIKHLGLNVLTIGDLKVGWGVFATQSQAKIAPEGYIVPGVLWRIRREAQELDWHGGDGATPARKYYLPTKAKEGDDYYAPDNGPIDVDNQMMDLIQTADPAKLSLFA
jgi:hypothetical protein